MTVKSIKLMLTSVFTFLLGTRYPAVERDTNKGKVP